jgi:hypothetical protein
MKAPSSTDLRALAEEMDRLQRMETWCKDPVENPQCFDFEPRVEWRWAAACVGYEDVRKAVQVKLRRGGLEQLISAVLAEQRQKVAELKQTVLGQ